MKNVISQEPDGGLVNALAIFLMDDNKGFIQLPIPSQLSW